MSAAHLLDVAGLHARDHDLELLLGGELAVVALGCHLLLYTIVIVTHNMQQASRVSSWTLFMLTAEAVEFGPTNKIFVNPDDKRTEDYVTEGFG